MKKFRILTLSLCLILLVQMVAVPAFATEVAETESLPFETDLLPPPTEPAFGTVCVQNGCRTIEGMVPLAGSDKKLDTAQSAFLYEVKTGTVVYSYNPDMKLEPGNLTKLVAAVVALQTCNLNDKVVTTSEIYRLPADSHHAGLKPEEEMTVRDLIHCMILYSANDAAIAMAVHASGTQQAHTTKMNSWVESIGCTSTKFGNVHGLATAENTTTAREMVKIYLAAIQNPEIKTILGTGSYTKEATNKNEEFSFRSHNYMLDEGIIQDFYDDRVVGGMQSNNKAFGASIVVMAEDNNMQFVGVIMNAIRVTEPDKEWIVISYGNLNEMTDLLKLGFDSYKNKRILYDGMALSQFTVAGGECDAVGQAVVDVDSIVPVNAQMDNLVLNFSVTDGGLRAPVKKGDMIATVQVEYRGSVLTEAEVYAMGNVERADSSKITIHSAAPRSGGGGSGFLSTLGTICVIGLGLAAAYLAFNAYMRNRLRARRRKRRADRRRNR